MKGAFFKPSLLQTATPTPNPLAPFRENILQFFLKFMTKSLSLICNAIFRSEMTPRPPPFGDSPKKINFWREQGFMYNLHHI